jgi:hypothetical protein
MNDITDRDEFEQWLKAELDDLAHHHIFTCDRQGDLSRARRDGRRETFVEVAERVGLDYEHDPATCAECAAEREMMEERGHWSDAEIKESLEVNGVDRHRDDDDREADAD